MCRCAPSSRARRRSAAQPDRGVALAEVRRVGAQQRRQRRHLHREVHARRRAGAVALEQGARGEGRVDGGEVVECRGAAGGVAVGLGRGDGRLAEQVDGRRDAVLPQAAQNAVRLARRLADDEAVRHARARPRRTPHPGPRARRGSRPSASRCRSAAADPRRRPGSRSGGARGRRASGRPARRRRSGTARRAARRPARRTPSPGRPARASARARPAAGRPRAHRPPAGSPLPPRPRPQRRPYLATRAAYTRAP